MGAIVNVDGSGEGCGYAEVRPLIARFDNDRAAVLVTGGIGTIAVGCTDIVPA